MNSNTTTEQLPDKKELDKLSEKERRSFFRSLFKKMTEESAETAEETDKKAEKAEAEKPDNAEAEKKAAVEMLKKDKRFSRIEELLPRMEKLLADYPELNVINAAERYQVAYFVIVGAEATAKGERKPTARELVDALIENTEAVKLYETIRTAEIAGKNRDFPAHSASKGAATMPATVKNAPKTLNEARKEAYGYFGINN